jgi:hypothetical protein
VATLPKENPMTDTPRPLTDQQLAERITAELARHYPIGPNNDGTVLCSCFESVKADHRRQAFREHEASAVLALVQHDRDRLRAERDQARAGAFADAIDRFKSLADLAPDSERAPGLNFAVGALMAMRDRAARASS